MKAKNPPYVSRCCRLMLFHPYCPTFTFTQPTLLSPRTKCPSDSKRERVNVRFWCSSLRIQEFGRFFFSNFQSHKNKSIGEPQTQICAAHVQYISRHYIISRTRFNTYIGYAGVQRSCCWTMTYSRSKFKAWPTLLLGAYLGMSEYTIIWICSTN